MPTSTLVQLRERYEYSVLVGVPVLDDSYFSLHLNGLHGADEFRYEGTRISSLSMSSISKELTSRTYCLFLILLARHCSDCNMASALSPQLGHLPRDIWADIIISLADDKATLSRLALLSKELYSFIVPALYRHIDLEVARREYMMTLEDHSSKFIPPRSPFALFLRTVGNSPSLGQLVQTAKPTRPETDKTVDAAVNLLYEKLPNLRKLALDAIWRNPRYEATFFKRNPMALLRHVELLRLMDDDGLLGTFLQQSHIESITARSGLCQLSMPDCAARNTSSLLTLKIVHNLGDDSVSESDLERLLAWPRALEKLRCEFPVGRLWSLWDKEVADPTALSRVL